MNTFQLSELVTQRNLDIDNSSYQAFIHSPQNYSNLQITATKIHNQIQTAYQAKIVQAPQIETFVSENVTKVDVDFLREARLQKFDFDSNTIPFEQILNNQIQQNFENQEFLTLATDVVLSTLNSLN